MKDKDKGLNLSDLKVLLKWETIVSIILALISWYFILTKFNKGIIDGYKPIFIEHWRSHSYIDHKIDLIEIFLLSFLYYLGITSLINRSNKSK
jgi:hypothetical protein